MVFLAKSTEKICSLKLISESEGLPFDYLEKIISKLEKAGIVNSKKGTQGGYCLAKPANRIRIGEIINVLEGETSLVKCISGDNNHSCPRENKCLTRSFWKKIQDAINSTLNSLTLKDLIK